MLFCPILLQQWEKLLENSSVILWVFEYLKQIKEVKKKKKSTQKKSVFSKYHLTPCNKNKLFIDLIAKSGLYMISIDSLVKPSCSGVFFWNCTCMKISYCYCLDTSFMILVSQVKFSDRLHIIEVQSFSLDLNWLNFWKHSKSYWFQLWIYKFFPFLNFLFNVTCLLFQFNQK